MFFETASRLTCLPALAGLLAALSTTALAHDPRPLAIDLRMGGERIEVSWKTPASIDYRDRPAPRLGEPCVASGPSTERRLATAYAGSQRFDCSGAAGRIVLETGYRGANPALSTVVRLLRDDKPPAVYVLAPDVAAWTIPGADPPPALGAYFRLGVEHLFGGIDHLLFLLCLIVIAGNVRRVVVAATGFTLAHSITLAGAALGVVSVPVLYVEAMIALSIVFMAAEILRGDKQSLTWRHPGLVALLFGLLHGFGFANVLAEIGLPSGQALAALALFNLGIETAQLVAIGIVTCGMALIRALSATRPSPRIGAERAAALGTGIVAAFWCVERVFAFG